MNFGRSFLEQFVFCLLGMAILLAFVSIIASPALWIGLCGPSTGRPGPAATVRILSALGMSAGLAGHVLFGAMRRADDRAGAAWRCAAAAAPGFAGALAGMMLWHDMAALAPDAGGRIAVTAIVAGMMPGMAAGHLGGVLITAMLRRTGKMALAALGDRR